MKTVLCLFFAIVCCLATSSRIYYPEEDDINYKRFQLLRNKAGDEEVIDLNGKVTVKADLTHMTYYLYTKHNLEDPHIIRGGNVRTLSEYPHFDPMKKTFLLIHGWVDNYNADLNILVKGALFKRHDINVIVVDWAPIAAESYSTAKEAVSIIGKYVGDFVNGMIDTYGITGSSITLIGHSLGAHIAGNAGSVIKSPVGQIIGLDPAAPGFTVDNTQDRLDASDGQYVQVIHTNGRFLGFSSSIGHADYYPNGGMVQAGCGLDLLGGCSHARAFEYLAESIENDATFTSTLCVSYADYQDGKCKSSKKGKMGTINVDKTVVGDFFLDTNTAAPYSLG